MLKSFPGKKLGTDSEMHLDLVPIDMYGVLLLSTTDR
jgi:hypothetical protein